MGSTMDATLPDRTVERPLGSFTNTSAGPQNANTGHGKQTNNTISGGHDNSQHITHNYNTYYEVREETPPLPTHTLPFERDPCFVERAELTDLYNRLSSPGARVALFGLGGVGKSQLAIELCYRLREQQPDLWVLWIHAGSAERFDQDVRKLADDVKIPGRNVKEADIYQLVYDWLRDSRKTWLVVLDNADNADFLAPPQLSSARNERHSGASRRRRFDYLPVCSHGSILVTTRRQGVASEIVDTRNAVELRPDSMHARLLLMKRLDHAEDNEAVAELAAALEYMPLAVAQAAAYINRKAPRCSIQAYMARLEKSEKSKTNLLNTASKELRRDMDAKNSILLTWQISFEEIHATRRSAANRLSLMSFFNYQGIPELLVNFDIKERHSLAADDGNAQTSNNGIDHAENNGDDEVEATDSDSTSDGGMSLGESINDVFDDDIDMLRDFSFISVTSDGSTFEMHRLVQLAAQLWLRKERKEQQWWEAQSMQRLDDVFPHADYEQWSVCRALYPHARLLLNHKTDEEDLILYQASILHKASWFAADQGEYAEGELMAMKSLDARTGIYGRDDISTLASLTTLAQLQQQNGKYKEAEKRQRQALKGWEKELGTEHDFTLTCMNDLASVLEQQGKYNEAQVIHQQALKSRKRIFGLEHSSTLNSMNNLAIVYGKQGKYDEAEKMQRRALESKERAHGIEHPSTLASLGNLATVLRKQGKHVEAEKMHRRALEGTEKVFGTGHPNTLKSMDNLGIVLGQQGKYTEAEEMHRRALEGKQKALGPEHPDTLANMDNLGIILENQEKYEEAEKLHRRALEGREKVLGEHPDTLTSMDNLAVVLGRRRKYEEAEELHRRALKGYERMLGEHPDTLGCMHCLIALFEEQGKHEEAEEMRRRALDMESRMSRT